ncbi:MAG: hypothetical protein Q7J35_19240 [Candidatus Methanoperedens sp.]|nr:hypothetical protein [Candidatus Methanoperedens sp.]
MAISTASGKTLLAELAMLKSILNTTKFIRNKAGWLKGVQAGR